MRVLLRIKKPALAEHFQITLCLFIFGVVYLNNLGS